VRSPSSYDRDDACARPVLLVVFSLLAVPALLGVAGLTAWLLDR
jgi:hypothetical protein